MSNPTEEQEGKPSKGKKLLPIALIGLVGAGVGGGMGTFLVGPALGSKPAHAAEQAHGAEGEDGDHAEEEEHAEDDSSHGEKSAHGESGAGDVYLVENVVLNPAGSGGTRFLMVTLALELKEPAIAEKVQARDSEVRDAVLRVLGSKTVEQLADMTARDSLKTELRDEIGAMFGKRSVR